MHIINVYVCNIQTEIVHGEFKTFEAFVNNFVKEYNDCGVYRQLFGHTIAISLLIPAHKYSNTVSYSMYHYFFSLISPVFSRPHLSNRAAFLPLSLFAVTFPLYSYPQPMYTCT